MKSKRIIYRVQIWRRRMNEFEPAEDYFADRALAVGDIVDLWHDSRPRNFRICAIRDGEITVGEDVMPGPTPEAPGAPEPDPAPARFGRSRRWRVVDDRGALYRMSDLAFLRYLRDGARAGDAWTMSVAAYGRHIGSVDFRAAGAVRSDFVSKLQVVERDLARLARDQAASGGESRDG